MSTDYIPFARPDIDDAEIAEVTDCLRSGWITTGPRVRRLEEETAARVHANYGVAVNSATAAMHLALEAAGTRPGDLVFIPTYTFAATGEVVNYFNAIPILVDSDPDTLNMDPADLRRKVEAAKSGTLQIGDGRFTLPPDATPRAVIPVHIAGLPAEMDEIYAIALEHGLSVIEDAAHALPSAYRGRCIGATPSDWPDEGPIHATAFSFYATKTMTTAEGGLLTTDREDVAERCRMMSLHGITKNAWNRYTASGTWYYEIMEPGFKYNLTDLAAALGLVQLTKLDRMWQRRCDIASIYNEAFADLPVQRPVAPDHAQHAWHLYVLRIDPEERDPFIQHLADAQIGTSVHFIPLHLHPYYTQRFGYVPEDFPMAYHEFRRAVSLPIYSAMNDEEVGRVVEAVRGAGSRQQAAGGKVASISGA